MTEQYFWLSHAPIKIVCEEPSQISSLARILKELRQDVPPSCASVFTISFEPDEGDAPPTEAVLVHEGPFSKGLQNVATQMLATRDKEWLIAAPHGSVVVDWASRTAVVRHSVGGKAMMHSLLDLFALAAALETSQQIMLHGAGLRIPDCGDALLLFAPSGFGKTTTSLAMALEGFALITDDALVLKADAEPQEVWGLPRAMKVHQRTLELLPALQPLLGDTWDINGEQEVTREAFAKVGPVAPAIGHRVAAVLVVDERTDGPHQLVPLAKTDALIAIANDNLGRSSRGLGVPARHVRSMETLAKLLAKVPAGKLHVGRPLDSLGRAVEKFVAKSR